MIELAAEALGANRVKPEQGGLCALHHPRGAGHGDGDRAVELSVPDGGQFHRAGADGRQFRSSSSMPARRCWPASASPWRQRESAGLPAGLFQNLVLGHADTEKLIGFRAAIDHVNFTGSVEGGRRIEKAAAGTFATLGLELGGKDPAYVRADADLANAVGEPGRWLVLQLRAKSCCGVERIYVHESGLRRLRRALRRECQAAGRWAIRWTRTPSSDPMARGNFADHVRLQTAEAVRGGATRHAQCQARSRPAGLALSGAGGADQREPPDVV
jgi:hypothetical protein